MGHFPIAMSNNQMVNTSNNMVWDGCVLKWGMPQYASKLHSQYRKWWSTGGFRDMDVKTYVYNINDLYDFICGDVCLPKLGTSSSLHPQPFLYSCSFEITNLFMDSSSCFFAGICGPYVGSTNHKHLSKVRWLGVAEGNDPVTIDA